MHGAPFKPWQGHTKKTFCTRPGHDRFPISHPEGAGGVTSTGQPLQPLHPNPSSTRSSAGKRSQQQPAGNTGGRVQEDACSKMWVRLCRGPKPRGATQRRSLGLGASPRPVSQHPAPAAQPPELQLFLESRQSPSRAGFGPFCVCSDSVLRGVSPRAVAFQLWLFSLPVWAFGTGLHLSPRQGLATTGHQHSSPAPTVPPQHLEVLSSALQKKKNIPQTLPSTSPQPDPALLPPFGQEPPESHCGLGKGPSTPNPSWGAAIGAAPQP